MRGGGKGKRNNPVIPSGECPKKKGEGHEPFVSGKKRAGVTRKGKSSPVCTKGGPCPVEPEGGPGYPVPERGGRLMKKQLGGGFWKENDRNQPLAPGEKQTRLYVTDPGGGGALFPPPIIWGRGKTGTRGFRGYSREKRNIYFLPGVVVILI